MDKKEFEDIIRPLVLLPNDQRKLLKEVLMKNFNKWAENKQLTLTEVGCSFSIGFTQYIAKEHYKLVNIIGKTHYWMNEEFYKTTEQLLKDYKETLC